MLGSKFIYVSKRGHKHLACHAISINTHYPLWIFHEWHPKNSRQWKISQRWDISSEDNVLNWSPVNNHHSFYDPKLWLEHKTWARIKRERCFISGPPGQLGRYVIICSSPQVPGSLEVRLLVTITLTRHSMWVCQSLTNGNTLGRIPWQVFIIAVVPIYGLNSELFHQS